jgi:hypothetical protein
MYYQYSVTLPLYGMTPGERIVLNSLVMLWMSLFGRVVLFFLTAGINLVVMVHRDRLFIYLFPVFSGLVIRTLVSGDRRVIYGLYKVQRDVSARS